MSVRDEDEVGELRRSLALLRATFESTADGILAVGNDGRVTDCNRRYAGLWRVPPEVLESREYSRLLAACAPLLRDPRRFLARIEEIRASGLRESHDILDLADGRVFEHTSRIQVVDGREVGRVWSLRDISDRKRGERSLAEERERLRITLSSIGDAVISTDAAGRVSFLNYVAEELTGWTQAEAVGQPLPEVFTIVNEDTRLPVENPALRALREGVVVGLANHTVLIARDGSERPIDDSAAPMHDENGDIVGAVLVFRDISERQQAEETRARLAAIIESSEEAIVSKTLDEGRIVSWNAAAERLFGYTAAEAIGQKISLIIPPDRLDEERRILERLRRGERIPLFETVRVTKDGRRLDIALTISPVHDRYGRVIGTAKVARDVTAQKRAARALRLSEERSRLALDIARLGTWSWDIESGGIIADERCREICGLSAVGALAPADIRARIHPDDLKRLEHAFAIAFESEERPPFAAELRIVHNDGSVRWIASRCRTIEQGEEADASVTVIGTVSDVTGQKSAENALRATADRLTLAMTAASLGDWSWDAATDLVTFSERAAEIVGVLPRLQIPWADMHALLHADDREGVRREIERALVDGIQYDMEFRIARPDGGEVWVSARGRAHHDAGGLAVGIFGVLQDITDRKHLEHELRHRAEALADADRKKDEFLATLAHELRNPLAPLRNGLQVMRLAGANTGMISNAWGMMDRQLSHMVRLIDDLLDVSRISRNRLELRRTRVTLAEVVSSAVETARPVIDAARHELVVTLPTVPVFLYADLTRLAQVLSNLLTNSAKYTEPGGQIRLTAERGGDEVVVSVADNGIGIPVRALPTIFDMFSQVDRGTDRAAGGLGIGLALVKRLVEMHGGAVSAVSDGPGTGSTFTVRIPTRDSQRAEAREHGADQLGVSPRRSILVVDDNPDSATSMAMMLELLGHTVETAGDGLEAVEAAERLRPEVILMDVGMPRLNGLDATRRIRETPWGRAMTIIALTGWGQEGDREQSRQAGCDTHLVKPVHLPDLKLLLARLSRSGEVYRRED